MKLHRSVVLAGGLLLSAGGCLLACGGDDSTGLVSDDGGADVTVADTSLPDTALPDTSLPDTAAADTSVPDTSTNDSSTKDSSAGDGGSDAPLDVQLNPDSGTTLADSGPGGDGAVLSCGSASCKLPEETCCVYPENSSFYVACSNGAACPALDAGNDSGITAVALQCEDQANCSGGLICCITSTNDGGTISAHCANACQGGEQHAVLCDPTAGDAGCAADAGCSSANIGSWGLPSGFGTCGGVLR